jgi:tetratricopeptide (TPR) repeat protein
MDAAQRMLDLKPNLPSYGRAAHLRWLQGDSAGAKLLYQQAIHAGEAQKDPEPRAWMIVQAAWLFWHEGDYRGAQAGFDAALAQLPKYAPALEGKGKAALALGDYVDAVRWLEQAYQAHPLIETAWWLGDAYQLKGDAAQARKYHERVERDGERLDPRTLALYLATRDREPEKALRLARAEHAQRADVWSKDVLAWASYRAGLLQDALKLSAEALAHGTKDARLLYHAGVIRRAAGASAEGDALIEQATRLNPYFDRILLGRTDGTLAQNP